MPIGTLSKVEDAEFYVVSEAEFRNINKRLEEYMSVFEHWENLQGK
jgi:tetrahydromethanopterin S-methyltransferase subunit G